MFIFSLLNEQSCVNARDELSSRKIRITLIRYVNLAWILLLRLMSDQTAKRFSVSSLLPKSKRPHHHFYHPWSIANDEQDDKRTKHQNNSSNAQTCPSPCSLPTPEIVEGGFAHFNAFQAADDKVMVENLKAFNNDQSECLLANFI